MPFADSHFDRQLELYAHSQDLNDPDYCDLTDEIFHVIYVNELCSCKLSVDTWDPVAVYVSAIQTPELSQ